MCADIYRTKRSDTFLLVPKGANLGAVPHEILTDLGQPEFLATFALAHFAGVNSLIWVILAAGKSVNKSFR
jgi:uncharacterized protein YcgL (UPF0745 family)